MIAAARSSSMSRNCHCEDLGLVPGMTLKELNRFETCTEQSGNGISIGWVCPTVDRLRRKMGN
jgi:hypothetical protein